MKGVNERVGITERPMYTVMIMDEAEELLAFEIYQFELCCCLCYYGFLGDYCR